MNKPIHTRLPSARATLLSACAAALCLALSSCASTPAPKPATAPQPAATAVRIHTHVAPTTQTRMAVIQAAARQLGASGFSDTGLIEYAYTQVGVRLPQAPHALLDAGEPISLGRARPGDLVFYRTELNGGEETLRVGLFLNHGEMLYASPRRNQVVIQPINGDYWTGRLLGAIRILP